MIDPVVKSIESLPQQLKQSWTEARKFVFPENYRQVDSVVVAGMGGSRFPAIIVKELFKKELTVPIIINDNYEIPGFVDEKTLMVLSSYSGTTEEVIRMGEMALRQKAKILGITTGGQISSFCKQHRLPCYVFKPIFNPSGQPRIGFGYAVGGILGLIYRLGLLKIDPGLVDGSLVNLPKLIKNFSPAVSEKDNPARQLAKKVFQKYPYYIVSEFLTGVGNAVANQTNETAKSISDFRIIPELNHHLMEGLKHPDSLKKAALFVFFFSKLYSPSIKKRYLITKDVVGQNKIETVWFELAGKNAVEQTFELMALGSYMTMYLSRLYNENPAAIPYVNYFKKKLKEMK